MSRVLAQATVELLEEGSTSVWDVDVTGHLEGEEGKMHRFYTISAKTDDNAAQEGIRRFTDEMEKLLS
jgi:hypothetical protein